LMVESISNRLDVSRNSSFFFFCYKWNITEKDDVFCGQKLTMIGVMDDQWMMGSSKVSRGNMIRWDFFIAGLSHQRWGRHREYPLVMSTVCY
jgi:hypothetical protein